MPRKSPSPASQIKRLLWLTLPPFAVILGERLAWHIPGRLFGGHDSMFKTRVTRIERYGEYGVGKSSLWVFKNTGAKIMAVDSSKQWIDRITSRIGSNDRWKPEWVDLGDLGRFGRPLSYEKRDNFLKYAESIWQQGDKPQLVLIDGRFRVLCFLCSLLHAEPGTEIIFDDYTNRRNYHIVEEILEPAERCGRQCLFIVPETFDRQKVKSLMDQFLFVMD